MVAARTQQVPEYVPKCERPDVLHRLRIQFKLSGIHAAMDLGMNTLSMPPGASLELLQKIAGSERPQINRFKRMRWRIVRARDHDQVAAVNR